MLKEKKTKAYLLKLYDNLEKAYKYFYTKDFPINSTKCMMYRAIIDLQNENANLARDKIIQCIYVARELNMGKIYVEATSILKKI